MKTLSNAELQDAIRYSTECVKNCLKKSNEYQLHLEQLVALLDEQRRRASERVELTLEPMTATLERAEFDARVEAHDGPEWVEWGGGECPVSGDNTVDVETRARGFHIGVKAALVDWLHNDLFPSSDVIRYRNWTAWEQSK